METEYYISITGEGNNSRVKVKKEERGI